MTTTNYVYLCVGIAVLLPLALLYIPGFSELVEQLVLRFLSTNARCTYDKKGAWSI